MDKAWLGRSLAADLSVRWNTRRSRMAELSKVRHHWTDAWLLIAASLASADAQPSLRALITAADAIQHAVPAFDEVDGGLARLCATGPLQRGDTASI